MSHTGQVRASFGRIPREKRRVKLAKLVIAAGLIVLLALVAIPKSWPVSVDLALAAAAGYCISTDVMRAIVQFLVAAIRDVLAVVKQ